MKKAITYSSFSIKSPLWSPPSQNAAAILQKITVSLDKPDGFSFRWPHQYQSNPTEMASETTKPDFALAEFASEKKLDYPLLAPQENHEITKTQPKRALTPLELTTTTPDPPPLGPNPGPGPDFPGPPLPPPPIPDIPSKPPRNQPPQPPDGVPPRTPPQIVPPPLQMPPPPVPPDI